MTMQGTPSPSPSPSSTPQVSMAQVKGLFSPASMEPNPMERNAILALKIFAWVSLLVGVLGGCAFCAMGLLTNSAPDPYGFNAGLANMQRMFGLLAGLGILLEGLFVWAVFLVFASMADSLIMIRRNTASH